MNLLKSIIRTKERRIYSAVVSMLFILSFSYLFLFYKESEIANDFPIPLGAKLVKTDKDNTYEKYKWGMAVEENSLPPQYWTIVRLWGWQEIEREGTVTIYKKDGVKVYISWHTNEFYVGLE